MQNAIRKKSFSLQSLEISVIFLLLGIAKISKLNLLWEQSSFSQDSTNSNNNTI